MKNPLNKGVNGKGQTWRIIGLGLSFIIMATLVGCSQPASHWTYTKQTTAELRQNYIHALKGKGARVIKLGETVRIVVPTDNLFMYNSANLQSRGARSILKTAAKLMKTYQKVSVKVAAYSDNIPHRGPKHRKQALTTRQAQVVASYLWSRGIDARMVYAKGYSKRRSVAWNATGWGRTINRRVEISFRFYPSFKNYD